MQAGSRHWINKLLTLSEEERRAKRVENELLLYRINLARVMSEDLIVYLRRQLEADINRHTTYRTPHDPEIVYTEVAAGLFVRTRQPTLQFPYVEMTIAFPNRPPFAKVEYTHSAKFGEGNKKEWTKYILHKVDDEEHYCLVFEDTPYYDLPSLSQALLSPLMDVNFKPPER